MREYKFRAKKKFTGTIGSDCWIYSSNVRFSKAGDTKILYLDGQQCILETLGQFSGQTCKNGTEIYEGDKTDPEEDGIYAICAFHEGSFGWWFYEQGDSDAIEFDTMDSLILDRVEIIGNIHEATK